MGKDALLRVTSSIAHAYCVLVYTIIFTTFTGGQQNISVPIAPFYLV